MTNDKRMEIQDMFQDYVKTLRDFYSSCEGDYASVTLDPQIEWIEPDVPDLWFSGTHHGPDAVLKEVIEPAFGKVRCFPHPVRPIPRYRRLCCRHRPLPGTREKTQVSS